jgi:hypothetical protein
VCACAFSLRRECLNLIVGDKPLSFEVVLSHKRRGRSGLREAEPNKKKEGRTDGSPTTLHGGETGAVGALRSNGGEEAKMATWGVSYRRGRWGGARGSRHELARTVTRPVRGAARARGD